MFLKGNSLRVCGVELELLKRTIFEVLLKPSSFTVNCGSEAISRFSLVLLRLKMQLLWAFGLNTTLASKVSPLALFRKSLVLSV